MALSPQLGRSPAAASLIINPVWIVGFVGHRSGIDEAALGPVLEAELKRLRDEISATGGALHFYSSVADGADLLALDVAERLGLALHLVLPLPDDEFFRPFHSAAARERAKQRLAAVRAQLGRHTWRVAPTSMQLPDAYFEADVRIVEACDVLLVVWDGKPETGLGGTAQLVNLAKARRCPIVWIHKDTRQVNREHFAPAWPKPDAKLGWLEKLGVARMSGDAATAEPQAVAQQLKDNLSALARRDARWFRGAIGWISGLSAAAALCGAIGGLLPHDTPVQRMAGIGICVAEFVLLIWVIVFKLRNRRKKIRDEWIDARFAADLYRGLAASQPIIDPLHPAVAPVRSEWRRFALTVGLLLHMAKAPAFNFVTFRSHYDKTRLQNQRDYFRTEGKLAEKATRWWSRIGDVSIAASPVFIALAFANRVGNFGWNESTWSIVPIGLLPVILPLASGVASSLTSLLDYDRRATRYPELHARLVKLSNELPHQHTVGSFRQFVSNTEAMLLDELLEWYSVTSRVDPN